MTWFKVDDSFHSHPKVLAAEPAALGLWVVAGSWCGANLTDGLVPEHVLPRLLPDAVSLARQLVACGLWRRAKGGYRFHDWAAYQPTREEATAVRDKKSSGGRLGNHRRWHVGKRQRDPNCPYCQGKPASDDRSDTDRTTEGGTESPPNPPDPTRPVPTRGGGSVSGSSSRRNARTREDDDSASLDETIDTRIIELLAELTGRDVDDEHAAAVRRRILGGRQVANPLAYVAAAIRGAPRDYLPGGTHPAARPLREALEAAADHGQHTDPNDDFRRAREQLGRHR